MSIELAQDVSFCVAGGRVIFMNMYTSRFFGLPGRHEEAFIAYFKDGGRSPLEEHTRSFLVTKGIVVETTGRSHFPLPKDIPPAEVAVAFTARPPLSLRSRAIWAQLQAALALRFYSLRDVADRLTIRKSALRSPSEASEDYGPIIAAIQSTDLFLPPHNRCLSRSIAFLSVCLSRNLSPNLVIGVRSNPFRAHAWVQWNGCIVHDDLHQSELFTPIYML